MISIFFKLILVPDNINPKKKKKTSHKWIPWTSSQFNEGSQMRRDARLASQRAEVMQTVFSSIS